MDIIRQRSKRRIRRAVTILISFFSLFIIIFALNPPKSSGPVWSPDGKQIAFEGLGYFDIHSQIYSINTDSSGRTRLTEGLRHHENPVWSPDGKQIAFFQREKQTSNKRFEVYREDIYAMEVDGRRRTRLTDDLDGFVRSKPSWSPDSKRIIFSYYNSQKDKRDIYSIDIDTKKIKNLTKDNNYNNLVGYSSCSWSPDGKKIAFSASTNNDSSKKIYIMNADGSGPIKELESGYLPIWSPDGKRIAFLFEKQMLSLELDSLELTKLAQAKGRAFINKPIWSPDGQKLAFVAVTIYLSKIFGSMHISDGEIYLVNTNGSGGMKHLATGFSPTWSPDSKQIAFSSNGSIYIIDTTTLKSIKLVAGSEWDIARL